MTRVDGRRRPMQQWILVPMTALLLVACSKTDKTAVTNASTNAPSRGAILTEATTNYTYGPERAPIPVDTTLINAPGGTLPVITISTATQVSGAGRVAGHRFTHRLTSSTAYPTMGIAPGAIWGFHFLTTDSEGSLYVGEDMAFRIQKFVPRKDGNPVQIIGSLMQ